MGLRGRSGNNGGNIGGNIGDNHGRTDRTDGGNFAHFTNFKLAPIARAIALTVAAGSAVGSGVNANAAQPFSAGWYGAMGVNQRVAAATGYTPNGKPASAFNPAAQQQAANTQLQQSIANLTLAAHGIAMMQAQQASWRKAALGNPSTIPNGLGVGGLDTGSLASSWINAIAPTTQTTDANGNIVVDIQQTADKAIANWETFNVGKNTIVQFDQASSDWAILNRINDPSLAPSQIQGQIRAPGTVLIVNKNGIVFSGSSQINVRNLVAGAAEISDSQFTSNGIYGAQTGSVYAPSFTNASGNLIVEAGAQINTAAPTSATQGGGYVLLMGQSVSNAGDIETPKGQVEMAAGDSFVIRKGVGTDGNQSSTTRGNEISPQLNAGSTAGQVINTGLLLAREGDITMAGHDVQQNGVAVATTSVNTRGTIHLLNSASDATGLVTLGANAVTTIALDDNGATALDSQRDALIAASAAQDLARPGTAVGQFDNLSKQTDRQDQSRIEIVSGGDVRFEGNSLSLATGGQIAVNAAHRTFAANGSILDVSGAIGVNLAMASNNVVVNVQGNELRDSPGNRDSGNLFNNNITVDRRDLILVPAGTGGYTSDRWYTANGLLEVSGYLNNQGHGIGEWAAQGGTVQLGGSEVVTQTGSQINLSGGTLNVATGYVAQTWLVGSDGNLYNANNAPADMTFSGVYKGFEVNHGRWGKDASVFFYNPLIAPQKRLENGYTVGRDAGHLIVNAPTSVIEGDIIAKVFTGAQQIRGRDAVDGYSQAQTAAAKAATLSFGQYGAGGLTGANDTDVTIGDIADITNGMGEGDALSADRINTTWIDATHLNAQGLGGLDLASSKSVTIDAPLALADGGALTVTAPQIDIDANITVHSGSIDLGNVIHTPPLGTQIEQWSILPPAAGASAQVNIASGSVLDLTGVWTNALTDPLTDPDNLAGLPYQNGGSLTVSTTGGIALEAGSLVDVSSGGAALSNGKLQGGKGGDVSLLSNNYAHVNDANFYTVDDSVPLVFDGAVRAYGFNGGGTLMLNAPQTIVIGDNGPAVSGPVLHLDTSLFSTGFTHYDITGSGGMQIADGTTLAPTVPVYRFTDGGATAQLWLPPTYTENLVAGVMTQRTGADLTLVTTHGDFALPQQAAIAVDPGQAVNIYAYGQTDIDGRITAHGGDILVAGAQARANELRVLGGAGGFSLTRSIWIGDTAVLDVSGWATTDTDVRGRRYGTVSGGGSIQLGGADNDASDAFVIIRPGALLDASGASAMIDVQNGSRSVPTLVASDGGLIALNSNSGIYIDGALRAAAGGEGASGGTLSMNLVSRSYQSSPASANAPAGIGDVPEELRKLRNITVTQHQEASGLDGLAPGQADPDLLFGNAVISADQVQAGGFASLALKTSDLFVFKGDVNLSLSRSISLGGGILSVSDATPDIHVALSAPYIRIDGFTDHQVGVDAYSPGLNSIIGPSLKRNDSSFAVSADLLDIAGGVRFGAYGDQGSGSLRYIGNLDPNNIPDTTIVVDAAGFGQVNFISSGDIRFGNAPPLSDGTPVPGTVKTPGDLNLTAAQIYPLSGASVALYAGLVQHSNDGGGRTGDVFDSTLPAAITIRGNGAVPAVPASAFGDLSFIAATIDQGGVVRAPLGTLNFNTVHGARSTEKPPTTEVIFRSGSITSASANGLLMPFGGTSDGISYQGADGTLVDLGTALSGSTALDIVTGISVSATKVTGEAGSLLDLSGGGKLTGAGFISGRGGSVDTLKNPLIDSNPANKYSSAGNKVYAIMPGYASAYAPAIASNGGGDPAIGRQITIPAGVPGLAAGTYTLLPSSYALLPGAFRVEVGGAMTSPMAPTALPGGAYLASGTMGVANTGIHDALPTQLILSSGKQVRSTSQYNEMSYADFARSQAAQFGNVRPRLEVDGKILQFGIGASDGSSSLSFAGTANFAPADDGIAGSLLITSSAPSNIIDITAPGAAPVIGHSSISSDDLNAFHAASLFIGGAYQYIASNGNGEGPRVALGAANASGAPIVNLLDGADLRAGQVFLVGTDINVAGGATIDTRGQGTGGLDSSFGYVFANNTDGANAGPALLVVANGWLNFLPMTGTGRMDIVSGASLLTEGSIVLGAPGALTMGDVNFGARYITVAQDQINIGDAASLAAAQADGVLQPGWNLDQSILNQLLHPSSSIGVPALERLTLTAGGAINLFGNVALDARGQAASDVEFVLSTPAIYGLGTASDTAVITADHLLWNGVRTGSVNTSGQPLYSSHAPAAIIAGGAGTGTGNLTIQAKEITFGYDEDSRPTDGATLDRIAVGFANVNLSATDRITGNSDGTLSIGQSKDSSGALVGGNLNITTPLLTGQQGSTIAYKAGGAIRVASGSTPADTSTVADYGGTISLTGDSVFFDTAVALPSGKLTLAAANDLVLGANSRIDLAGRTLTFFDQTEYSWGGDLVLSSTHGDISQNAGSIIDVSAQGNAAGSITASAIDAAHGHVSFGGALLGATGDGYSTGRFNVAAQNFGDFAELNRQLNTAGFFGSRSFALKQGDLVVGDEVKAQTVSISVDAGNLTVNGTIDASGAAPGSIRLAATGNLTLASSAVLDAHGTALQTDSYGAAIDANNTAHVDLTSSAGMVTLSQGAAIDLQAADGVARGKLEINAPRLGSGSSATGAGAPTNATGNDIAISAAGPLDIRGAGSIAVNGFSTYTNAPADPGDANGQVIDQAWLDKIHQDSTDFINAAGGNLDLQNRLAGLKFYGPAFHLRPGVEIASATPDGNLSTKGDLDLSNYRYGPGADTTGHTGAGEVGVISFRAGGNLKINGSINDGFAPPAASPDALTVLATGTLSTDYTVTTAGQTLSAGSIIVSGATTSFDLPGTNLKLFGLTSAKPVPVRLVLGAALSIPAGRIVTGTIRNANGDVIYGPGGPTTTTAGSLPAGTIIEAGTFFSGTTVLTGLNAITGLAIQPTTIPAGTSLLAFGSTVASGGVTLSTDVSLAIGAIVPAKTKSAKITGPGDRQVWAIAPMLEPGSQSWSMRFVAGADMDAADSRALQSVGDLAANSGNITLNDPFVINVSGKGVQTAGISVVRTGTGDLEILAGGSYQQSSPFGVYTAGTAIAVGGDYNIGRGVMPDGTILGTANAGYAATLNAQRMYYTEGGGDFLLAAQGDIGGFQKTNDSLLVGNWLWRQGGNGQATAWGINFGSYVANISNATTGPTIELDAFSGMGALGGGKVSLNAGRDIGNAGQGIVVAVGGSGRVTADGNLIQTGGGALSVTAGRNVGVGGNQFIDLRGDTTVAAGSFGSLVSTQFGTNIDDPRHLDALKAYGMATQAGGTFAVGDGAISVQTRGDLAMGSIDDPGRLGLGQQTATGVAGTQQATWFTLWTPATAIDLMAAGGDLSPFAQQQGTLNSATFQPSTTYLPSILRAVTANGSIYLAPANLSGESMQMPSANGVLDLLARDSIIESVINNSAVGALSTSPASIATPFRPAWVSRTLTLLGVSSYTSTITASNIYADPNALTDTQLGTAYDYDSSGYSPSPTTRHTGSGGILFAFGPNTVSDNSAMNNALTSHIYAVNGDITSLGYGTEFVKPVSLGAGYVNFISYRAAKPVAIMAGDDIVDFAGLILQDDPNTVSTIAAGGDIIHIGVDRLAGNSGELKIAGLQIAGPGTLEMTAGKNIYQGSTASIESIGPLVSGDNRPGASIVLQAGAGKGAPGEGQVDWSGFARLYLDPANLAGSGPLADQPGKVAKTYSNELVDWLKTRFGYAGTTADAMAYFLALPAAQQRVFLRTVYYAELTAGGREYNDVAGPRFGSYLRGRNAIGALFSEPDAYQGDITMFSAGVGAPGTPNYKIQSGSVHTDFGGDVQFLAPGGGVTVGTEGLAPGADAGLITQGGGNIQIYSQDSLLLGLSRIMTTFGGDILAWSATGDINAGRGSKTTVLFTPPKRTYDDIGDVVLAPQVPSNGAGIATLNPIPEVPAGDVDLIAPLGTIDAGEAGIRVSGNVNLAALQVANAANIVVKGQSTGLPLIASVNVGALTNAGAAATQAAMAAQDVVNRERNAARQALPSIFTVRVLSFGNEPAADEKDTRPAAPSVSQSKGMPYDPANPVQLIGVDQDLDPQQMARLSPEQQRRLQQRGR